MRDTKPIAADDDSVKSERALVSAIILCMPVILLLSLNICSFAVVVSKFPITLLVLKSTLLGSMPLSLANCVATVF